MKASIIQMNSIADKQRNVQTAQRLARRAIELAVRTTGAAPAARAAAQFP